MFGLKKKTWVIGGVVTALVGTAAFASLRDHSPQKRVERVTERVVGKLDLDATQKQAFTEVAKSYVNIRGTAPEFMLDLSKQLKGLAQDETLSIEEVNELREQIKAEFDRRTDILVPQFVTFYNTLDKTQKAKVVERLDKMGNRIEHRISKREERRKNKLSE